MLISDWSSDVCSSDLLVANVQWLTCSENMCVPERTQLTLDLVVGTGIGSRSSKDFDLIEQSLPPRLSNAGLMRRVGGTIEIEFANSVSDASPARLYPDDRTFEASHDRADPHDRKNKRTR